MPTGGTRSEDCSSTIRITSSSPDAAGYAENVNLYTAGHGLKSITRGSAPEAELLKALGLDPKRYFMALAQTVGK